MKWALLTGIVGFACADFLFGSIGCGSVPVRVCGVVTDPAGAPIEGATLLTLYDPEIVKRPEELELRRGTGRMHAERSREDCVRLAPLVGSAQTDASGSFEIIVGIGVSSRDGAFTGIEWASERGSAFHVARALLVEKEGYVPLVFETKDARWIEQQDGRIIGTLEVGTIRLARR